MTRFYAAIVSAIVFLNVYAANSASWERLYCKSNTDCYRNVREVPAGGYILAGYTSEMSANDTDGLVVRMNTNGDTVWTFVYNGPSSKEDCFYKVVPTSDGGFVLCGYSRSFGGGDNAFYMKLNSSGNMQWVKNWGGSGIERAQDIIQLSDGKFIVVGYTTTSPAHYYDAFILKLDASGNTLWSKIYGGTTYDDANSVKVLPDDGFIMGGQSNNDFYLIRTDANGDSLWTKTFGSPPPAIDNIECLNYAQGSNGFVIAGTTDGVGSSGGEDAYLAVTDTGGVVLWDQLYGGSDNDGFHRVEHTADGGYVAVGTSSEGPWPDPNLWIIKMDAAGSMDWENFFGGNHHDHGYSGQETSDGSYLVVGHTNSFADVTNVEDAIVIKTNSSGQSTNYLSYTTVTELISPVGSTCGNANVQVQVEIANYSDATVSNIPVTIEITGAITQTLTQTYNSSVNTDQVKTLTFTTPIDMSAGGTFHFHCYTGNPHHVIPAHNFLDETLNVGITSLVPSVTDGTHCGPSTVSLSASSPDQIKWYSALTGGSSLYTGSTFTTPYLTANTTYYAQAGTNCPSTRVPVDATITTGITPPTAADSSRCGTGTVVLAATSSNSVKWYDTPTSTTPLVTGATYTTNSLSSNTTFYAASENTNCTSVRTPVEAIVNIVPSDPVVTPASRCDSGIVQLSAIANDPVEWYDVPTGGSAVHNSTSFTTPVISNTTTYYVLADNGLCESARIPVDATINQLPLVNLGPDSIFAVTSSLLLDAGSGFSGYLWSTGDVTQTLNVDSTGSYCVTVTDANSCSNTECIYTDFSVGLMEFQASKTIMIYPNPTNNFVTLKYTDRQLQFDFSILDMAGKNIYSHDNIRDNEKIDLSFLADGIYIIRLSNDKSTLTGRLVIE